MRLAGRQHSRLVHHDQGAPADLDLALRGKLEELVDAVRTRIAVVAERHRRPPRHRRRHDLVAVLPVEVRDGPQCGGLARARRALDHRHPPAPRGGVSDRQRLLLAQRIALLQKVMDLVVDRLGRQPVAAIGVHGLGHVADRLFQSEIVAGGIDFRVDHAGAGFGRRLLRFKPLDLGVAAQPLDRRPHRVAAHQTRRRVRRRLHHVRAPEHRFLAGQMGGKIVQTIGELPDRLARNLHVMPGHRGDQAPRARRRTKTLRASAGGAPRGRCRGTSPPA